MNENRATQNFLSFFAFGFRDIFVVTRRVLATEGEKKEESARGVYFFFVRPFSGIRIYRVDYDSPFFTSSGAGLGFETFPCVFEAASGF